MFILDIESFYVSNQIEFYITLNRFYYNRVESIFLRSNFKSKLKLIEFESNRIES